MLLERATSVGADQTHRAVDVRIVDGTIDEVGDLTPFEGEERIDLDGYVLVPAAVEPHAHLDKAFLAERIVNPSGDLMGAITAMRSNRDLIDVAETADRAERAARLMATNGYRAVRSHADVTLEHGLRSVEALLDVKQRVADVIDLEIVALCGWPVIGPDAAESTGAPHRCDGRGGGSGRRLPAPRRGRHAAPTEFYLQTATDFGVGVDLHTDETLDPAVRGLADLASLVDEGFAHPVTASHCVSLGMQPETEQRATAEAVAEAGIGVIAVPHTNLFLQGRGPGADATRPDGGRGAPNRRCARRGRSRQSARPLQPGRASVPVRNRRADDHGRAPAPGRCVHVGERRRRRRGRRATAPGGPRLPG